MGNISINKLITLMRLASSGVAPVSTVAVSPVSSTVMAVSTFIAAPRAASAVSMPTMPAAPPPAVTPPTAAAAPVPAGARAPTAVAVAAPPAAVVTVAPPMTAGAPPAAAGAPSPPAVAVGAPPPPPAVGAPLSVGAVMVPRSLPAVPAIHHLLPPSLPVFLPVLCRSVSPQNLGGGTRFGRLLLFALDRPHSVHPAQDPQHRITRPRIRGLLACYRARLVLRAWRSCAFTAALLQQVAKQSLPQLLLSALELQRSLLLHLHPPELLLLLASAGLQLLKSS